MKKVFKKHSKKDFESLLTKYSSEIDKSPLKKLNTLKNEAGAGTEETNSGIIYTEAKIKKRGSFLDINFTNNDNKDIKEKSDKNKLNESNSMLNKPRQDYPYLYFNKDNSNIQYLNTDNNIFTSSNTISNENRKYNNMPSFSNNHSNSNKLPISLLGLNNDCKNTSIKMYITEKHNINTHNNNTNLISSYINTEQSRENKDLTKEEKTNYLETSNENLKVYINHYFLICAYNY